MPVVFIKNILDGITDQCQNAARTSVPMSDVINDMLTLNLVDICPNNFLQIKCKLLVCFVNTWKIDS